MYDNIAYWSSGLLEDLVPDCKATIAEAIDRRALASDHGSKVAPPETRKRWWVQWRFGNDAITANMAEDAATSSTPQGDISSQVSSSCERSFPSSLALHHGSALLQAS